MIRSLPLAVLTLPLAAATEIAYSGALLIRRPIRPLTQVVLTQQSNDSQIRSLDSSPGRRGATHSSFRGETGTRSRRHAHYLCWSIELWLRHAPRRRRLSRLLADSRPRDRS